LIGVQAVVVSMGEVKSKPALLNVKHQIGASETRFGVVLSILAVGHASASLQLVQTYSPAENAALRETTLPWSAREDFMKST
jgi:hypothetical protein